MVAVWAFQWRWRADAAPSTAFTTTRAMRFFDGEPADAPALAQEAGWKNPRVRRMRLYRMALWDV